MAANEPLQLERVYQEIKWRIVYGRYVPGFVLSDAHLPAATVSLVQVPAMAISSTDVRRRVAEGQPIVYLVPDGVAQYIAKRRLYQA